MIEPIEQLPKDVVGLRFSGVITTADYREVVNPLVERARAEGRRLRILFHVTSAFAGYNPGALWLDARATWRTMNLIDRAALVTDRRWLARAMRLFGKIAPYAVSTYAEASYDLAVAWLAQAPARHTLPHELREDDVLVVEPERPLRIQDVRALEETTRELEAGGDGLRGIVVHARTLPGWASPGSLWRHLRLAREQSDHIHRVAIAADGRLSRVAPALARLLVDDVELSRFGYDDLDEAIAWAHSGPSNGVSGAN